MLPSDPNPAPASRVTALFKTGAHSFPLPAGSTFADMAAHLEALSTRKGEPIAVAVKLAALPPKRN